MNNGNVQAIFNSSTTEALTMTNKRKYFYAPRNIKSSEENIFQSNQILIPPTQLLYFSTKNRNLAILFFKEKKSFEILKGF